MSGSIEALNLRPFACEQSLLSQSDGSSLFKQGDTSVMAAVYGPTEVRIAKELVDRAAIEVIYKPKTGLSGCVDRTFEKIVRSTCENVILTALHPRTVFTVVLQEIQDGGSLLACCINSACAALLDASAPMQFLIAGVHCIIETDGQIILDPTKKREVDAVASFTFAFSSRDKNVLSSHAHGRFSQAQLQSCLSVCKQAANQIFDYYKEKI